MPLYPEKRNLPPCPDPDCYILVQTKEGVFWRRKRGQKTPVKVNATLQANVQLMKICSPAAKRLLTALYPFTRELDAGRIHSRFVALLRKGLKGNHFTYAPFQGVELQPNLPIDRLLKSSVSITQPYGMLVVQVPIRATQIERINPLVSSFYLQAVLVCGDPLTGNLLKVEQITSPTYTYNDIPSITCTLQLPVTGKPWLLLLKFCSLEGNEPATNPQCHGMRVIEVGA